MDNIIEHLQNLFKARIDIDEQIKTALGFFEATKEIEKEIKQAKKEKKTYKPRKPREKKENYNCEECDCSFTSADKYLDVRCPDCQSKRVLKMP